MLLGELRGTQLRMDLIRLLCPQGSALLQFLCLLARRQQSTALAEFCSRFARKYRHSSVPVGGGGCSRPVDAMLSAGVVITSHHSQPLSYPCQLPAQLTSMRFLLLLGVQKDLFTECFRQDAAWPYELKSLGENSSAMEVSLDLNDPNILCCIDPNILCCIVQNFETIGIW